MRPSFTVSALAIAAERASAVGAVRLTCAPSGLEIDLLRVAAFTRDFAPGAVVESVAFTVPYTAVRGLVRRGRALCLALDPAVARPHARFTLVRFTDDPAEALTLVHRARQRARIARWLLPGPAGALAALLAPAELASGALGLASFAVVVGALMLVALTVLVEALSWGGPRSDRLRDGFEQALCGRLGLAPAPLAGATAADAPRLEPGAPARWPALLAAMGAALAGAAGLGVAWMARTPPVAPPSVDEARGGIASWALTSAREAPAALAEALPRCLCERAGSPLWASGVPRLGLLYASGPDDGTNRLAPSTRGGRPRYAFDLAAVNNGSTPVRDVRVLFTFARRDAKGQRVGVTDRGVFWEGSFAPGRAVRWTVKAPGSEVRIEPSVTGTLEAAGEKPAPADAFHALASAGHRVVRLHAATMLAYLRDPRASEVLASLGAPGPGEAETLARIARAAADVFVCDVRSSNDRTEACVFNASLRVQQGLVLREVAAGDVPGREWPLRAELPVHEGIRVGWSLEGASEPEELEVQGALQ